MRRRDLVLLIGALALIATVGASQIASFGITFNGSSSFKFSPLTYTQNRTFFPYEQGNFSGVNVMTMNVYRATGTLTISSTAYKTPTSFTSLNMTLSFGSTKVFLNGLVNSTSTVQFSKGSYPVSFTVLYSTQSYINETYFSSWIIVMSGR